MPEIFKEKQSRNKIGLLYDTSKIQKIEHSVGKTSIIKSVETFEPSGCLHCEMPHCAFYEESELLIDGDLSKFPIDHNNNVCPTNAIDCNSDVPKIDDELCFGCGLCVSRCVVGAIYLDNQKAIVNEDEGISMVEPTERNLQIHRRQIQKLNKIKHTGEFNVENGEIIEHIYDNIKKIKKKDANFVNIFTRNLMIQTGNKCTIRRQGDVYVRFDSLFNCSGHPGVCEIEFDSESLETPRAILDDIAILHARYNIPKNSIVPLIVCLELPNKRSEYWNVLKDIKNVLGIKIQSITAGILLVCMWNNKTINFSNDEAYIDIDNTSLMQTTNHVLNHKIGIKNSKYAIVEVKK